MACTSEEGGTRHVSRGQVFVASSNERLTIRHDEFGLVVVGRGEGGIDGLVRGTKNNKRVINILEYRTGSIVKDRVRECCQG